jgi:hypothetical protein
MPLVAFSTLPDVARVWVFGSSAPLSASAEETLLHAVDDYLAGWRAHGEPLTVGRDWREHRFLTIAVDPTASDASGCSLDALYRLLRDLERELGISLLDGGRVYYRDVDGGVQATDRAGFSVMAGGVPGGELVITEQTPVFNLTVPTLGEWRSRFETVAGDSWHAALLPVAM